MSETSVALNEKEAAIQALFTEIDKARENHSAETAQDKDILLKTGWMIPADYPEGHSSRGQNVRAERRTDVLAAPGRIGTSAVETLVASHGRGGLVGYTKETTDMSAPGEHKPTAKEDITLFGYEVLVGQSHISPETHFQTVSTTNRYPLGSEEAAPYLATLQQATESINTLPEQDA